MPRLDDGHSTTITFSNAPTLKLYEKEVTPPGLDGGGRNDTTTMRNLVWRTAAPKKLKTATAITFTAAYDPSIWDGDITSQINVNQLTTVNYPEGDTLAVWGWIDKWVPGPNKEGEQPTATVTFEISNQDDTGAEVGPVYTAAP